MNYTFYKVSSQVDVQILSFTNINCTDNECSTDKMDKHKLFKVDFDILNTGFSNAENIEAYIEGQKNFTVYKLVNRDSKNLLSMNENIDFLKVGQLPSLHKKSYTLYAKIPNE